MTPAQGRSSLSDERLRKIEDMKLKKCRYPTCSKLIPYDQEIPYCSDHRKYYHQRTVNKYRKTNYQEYNRTKRDKEANAFYHSKEWKRLSERLRRQSLWTCQCCNRTRDGKSFLVVDHIIPLKVDQNRRLDPQNLWVLCKECHFWKTKLEQKIYGESIVMNLDTSKKWTREKIKNWILTRENRN